MERFLLCLGNQVAMQKMRAGGGEDGYRDFKLRDQDKTRTNGFRAPSIEI